MVRQIRNLQQRNDFLEEENDQLGEKNVWIEKIMRELRTDGQGSEIISRLKRGDSHQSIAEWLGRPLVPSASPQTEREVSLAIEQYHQRFVNTRDPRYWTNATNDPQLIEHLITLYFTWIHPVHMLFDERPFMTSFRECSDSYCAPALVNVILAVSCHLLHKIEADDPEIRVAVDHLRNRFMEETRSLMKSIDHAKMTTVQTHAVMFLAEFGSGHGLMATSHLRLAVELLIERMYSDQAETSERIATWGIATLHT